MLRRVIILGSTGSIGTQALEVVEHVNALHGAGRSPVRFEVVGLAAGGNNAALLCEQARRFGARAVASARGVPRGEVPAGCRVMGGPGASEELVRSVECDVVLAAIVGSAGLPATLAAVELGRDVALANKETLVAAGELVIARARRGPRPVRILPVDSEHAGLWQCLEGRHGATEARGREAAAPPLTAGPELVRATITASGGPFRAWSKDRIASATPDDALKHPTWSMGAKVTVDSASLMNKALEVIEAHWLFGLESERIGVLIHPQSIVHAMAEFADGSVVAQLSAPDMRTPIQRALCHPAVVAGTGRALPRVDRRALEFEEPDLDRFPALGLARVVLARGGTSGAVLNAANEEAVAAFLASREGGARVPFPRIVELSAAALEEIPARPLRTLADCAGAEGAAREFVRSRLGGPAPVSSG